jgi:hypothetical protein
MTLGDKRSTRIDSQHLKAALNMPRIEPIFEVILALSSTKLVTLRSNNIILKS